MRLSSEGAAGEGIRGLSVHRDEEADRPAGSLGIGHEGMSMLATEDGGDCSAAHLLCDAEGCCARGYPHHLRVVFMSLLSAKPRTLFHTACHYQQDQHPTAIHY